MNTGVYTITNLINGKIYVGSVTTSFKKRKNHHFHHLRNHTHSNRHLQNAFIKYGEKNFEFEVLEEVTSELCVSIETFWCTVLDTRNSVYGYNIELPQIGALGVKRSEETRNKISKVLLGRKLSTDHRRNISLGGLGKIISLNQRNLISKIHKGKIVSKETRERISRNCLKNRPYAHVKINQLTKDMEHIKTWSSIGQAVEDLGVSYTAISNNLNNRSRTAGGFIFTYAS